MALSPLILPQTYSVYSQLTRAGRRGIQINLLLFPFLFINMGSHVAQVGLEIELLCGQR